MTPYQQKFLDHLVRVAAQDKALAWWSAKNFAELDPYQLSDLPALLTAEMKRLQGSNACANATGKPETLSAPSTSRLESGR